MSNKYEYEDRELFESVLVDLGYSDVTVQVYASAIVNPKATAHTQAKSLWVKHMEGLPLPTWHKVQDSSNRPSGLSYKSGERATIDHSDDTRDVPVKESKPTTDLEFLRLVLSKHEILTTIMEMPVDDDTKRKIITVILED